MMRLAYHRPVAPILILVTATMFSSGCQGGLDQPGRTTSEAEHAPETSAINGSTPNLGKAGLFVLPTLDGDIFDLSEHFGEVVVLNFWATWCAPCLEEIPGFVRLQSELGGKGLTFIGISVDEDGREVVDPFVEHLKINYPIAMDDGDVAASYKGNLVIPSTFVIDRVGNVRGRYIGAVTFETLVPTLRTLLAERPAG